jgi:hypothetical protein
MVENIISSRWLSSLVVDNNSMWIKIDLKCKKMKCYGRLSAIPDDFKFPDGKIDIAEYKFLLSKIDTKFLCSKQYYGYQASISIRVNI